MLASLSCSICHIHGQNHVYLTTQTDVCNTANMHAIPIVIVVFILKMNFKYHRNKTYLINNNNNNKNSHKSDNHYRQK